MHPRIVGGVSAVLIGVGLLFSGMSPDRTLPEIVEIPDHPWFIGVQFHPELKSKKQKRTEPTIARQCVRVRVST